jgi:hypothetical protein
MEDKNKCGHKPCNCPTDGDSKYCSSQCETMASSDITIPECECGHSGCA